MSRNATEDKWYQSYDALLEYGCLHDTFNVPCKVNVSLSNGKIIKLGRWLDKQRQLQRKDNLSPTRLALLQSLVDGGKLSWRISGITSKSTEDCNWIIMYNALVAYCQEFGTCNISPTYKHYICDKDVESRSIGSNCLENSSKHYLELGKWLNEQRHYKINGTLPTERAVLMQVLVDQGKLDWKDGKDKGKLALINRADEKRWQDHFNALVHYGQHHGHCSVPQSSSYTLSDGRVVKLGMWLQRQRLRKRKGLLENNREQKLQQLVCAGLLKWNIHYRELLG